MSCVNVVLIDNVRIAIVEVDKASVLQQHKLQRETKAFANPTSNGTLMSCVNVVLIDNVRIVVVKVDEASVLQQCKLQRETKAFA
ncbi:hypothetical protein Q3G72_030378 [Acer saccharum]|nr:hypothetical protein Q3G72_030378 [Acer saccharum]